MEQRVKKKYIEKKAPDKTDKPKYIPKQEKTIPQPKVQQETSRKPKRQYYEKPKLLQRISSQAEEESCVICSEHIRKKDYIWTCSCCYLSMHLKCIKSWILNVNRDKNKNQILFTWSCPQCKFQYNQPMPKYYCYCGKFLNPQFQRDLQSHSCGQICGRKRGTFCPHPCPLLCHKGKCKPCQHQGILINCQCGKSSRMVKCSQQRQIFQCGKKCQKILNCLKHKCQRNCHHGPCLPCKKKRLVLCYCKKTQDVVDCIQTSFSCEQICDKKLGCDYHKCLDKCHQGSCKQCTRTPQLQKTCPCGAYSIQMLTGDPNFRTKCSDPIPTCGMPCKKLLPCGHHCSKSCHQGSCSQCKIIVNQNCICGLTSRKIQCFKAHSHKQILKCDNICKKKRNCGQHSCNTQCCPHRNSGNPDDHQCQLTCQRMLNCGKHNCGQNCHMGLCKKCPIIYSQPQPCPCGKTFLRPPIICGTVVPQCQNRCQKQMQCGHKCMKACHYGNCQCFQEIFVRCRCGKQEIKTICGRQALCLNKCNKSLPCGHKCSIQCHKQTCQQAHKHHPCKKLCEKVRLDCGHTCGQHCHPIKKCTQFPCQAEIFIKCECGHRQTSILCGMTEQKKNKKEIKCNKKCENLKRFDVLYKGKQVYYPNNMLHFGLKNLGYIQNLELKLSKFILESEDTGVQIQYKFNDSQSKLILLNLFENHYHLNAHFYRHKKYASFTLVQTQNTMIPKPTLSEYINKISKGQIKRSSLPFQFTVSFQSQTKDRSEIILRTLKPYVHKYYLERKDKQISIHFWSKQQGIKIFTALQNENPYCDFKGQQHENMEAIEIIADTDIIQTQLTEEQKQANFHKDLQTRNFNDKLVKQNVEMQQNAEQPKKIMKTIPPPPTQAPKKKTGAPIIIIKKSNLVFQPKEYPESKQNVQDIYLIDQDELYNQQVDWDKLAEQLSSKNMGPQALQWTIRSLLIINSINLVQQSTFKKLFSKIVKIYEKDKLKAKRILQIQKLDTKIVKQQMEKDGIYLSNHEPQILAYLLLFNYFSVDKIDIQLQEYQLNTPQVTQAQQILKAFESNNFQEFYTYFKGSHYVLSCALIPFIHALRENTVDLLQRKQKIPSQNLYKYLLFDTQKQLLQYWGDCGFVVENKFSKKFSQNAYYWKEGQLKKQKSKKYGFIHQFVKSKRDKKYFLVEPQQLVDDIYMTRSFFAFGDFKQSVSNKYIVNLVKYLKSN